MYDVFIRIIEKKKEGDDMSDSDKFSKIKEEMDKYGFSSTYHVHLLSREEQTVNIHELLINMLKYVGSTEVMSDLNQEEDTKAIKTFIHNDYRQENGICAQTLIIQDDCLAKNGEDTSFKVDEMSIRQTWDFPECADIAKECKHSITLFIMLGGGLDYKKRIELFQLSLRACLETVSFDAIYHPKINKVINPVRFLKDIKDGDMLTGALNVRFYNINYPDGDSSMLVDTCGLALVGLPDLQCFFKNMDVNYMVSFIYNLAYYIYEKGDIIKDGETTGNTPDEKWICQHEFSQVAPNRYVINIYTDI